MTASPAQHPQRPDRRTAPARRPGWPELLVGLGAFAAAVALIPLLGPALLPEDPVVAGLVLTAWSGVAGIAGFALAVVVRIRSIAAFGVRRTSWGWIGIGVAGGVAAFVIKGLVNTAIITLTDFGEDPQGAYYDAANGGVLPLVLTFLFLSLLTPLGEELFFRGVVANALLRYGPWVGVLGSSAIFALAHGINIALPTAFIVGVIAAELMRRSGSVWPAVMVHVVHNLGLPVLVLLTGASGPA